MIENVTINDKHCLNDLGLHLTDVDIGAPGLRTNYVTIPGRDGFLDLSTSLDGEMHFDERKITLTFGCGAGDEWSDRMAAFYALVHGQNVKIVFDSDASHYYSGRGAISSFDRDGQKLTVKMSVTCQPYRYAVTESTTYRTLSTSQVSFTVTNNGRPVVPSITVTSETAIVFGDTTTTLSAGTWTVPAIRLATGANTIKAKATSGTGKITLTWHEVTL